MVLSTVSAAIGSARPSRPLLRLLSHQLRHALIPPRPHLQPCTLSITHLNKPLSRLSIPLVHLQPFTLPPPHLELSIQHPLPLQSYHRRLSLATRSERGEVRACIGHVAAVQQLPVRLAELCEGGQPVGWWVG